MLKIVNYFDTIHYLYIHPSTHPIFSSWEMLSLYHQINFVKDQQDDITAKLHAEYLALEEEIIGLGLEVSFSLLVLDLLLQQITNFQSVL